MPLSFVLLVAFATATGCGRSHSPHIGVSVATMQESVYGFMRDAMNERKDRDGVEVIWRSADNSEARQAADIDALISEGVDAIILHAVNTATAKTLVQKAADADIPVIAMDRLPEGAAVQLYVTADSRKVGILQAEYLAEMLGGKGDVVILKGEAGNSVADAITKGNREVLAKHPDMHIVIERPNYGWSREVAGITIEYALSRYPNIRGVLANNSDMAMGAVAELDRLRRRPGEVLVVGADADLDACKAILAGSLAADVDKQPRKIGLAAYDAALQAIRHQPVSQDETMDNGGVSVSVKLTPVQRVDSANVRERMCYRWPDLCSRWPGNSPLHVPLL